MSFSRSVVGTGSRGVPVLALASYQLHAIMAAVLLGGGLSLTVVAVLSRKRNQQRTLAAILDDTMGLAPVPVEVVSESPHNESSAFTARLGDAFGRLDSRGALEQRLERADIPLRSGEYLLLFVAGSAVLGVAMTIMSGSPVIGGFAFVLVAMVAWKLPASRSRKRSKKLQAQLPDALSLMGASVEGGHTFQRAIDMYRHDARPPLSVELDRVMAEVRLGSDLVVALENMADRCGVDDLKWAVEAVRIQQSTGGRLGPILHTLANFMRMRQEVRREVQTLSAEGRMSGYVLFGLPLFLALAISVEDPGYLNPMFHGTALIVLIGAGFLMAIGYFIVRKMVNIKI
jgi:tight adherence protein B